MKGRTTGFVGVTKTFRFTERGIVPEDDRVTGKGRVMENGKVGDYGAWHG
jgi:hypothetical protein